MTAARLLVLIVLLAGLPAAPPVRAALAPGESGQVTAVSDGDTLIIDGRLEVRLVGIQAPKLPLGRAGFKAWPLADEARTALADMTLGKRLRLAYGGQRIDRHGRALAQLYDQEGRWVQGEMLRLGLARVYTFADNVALAAEMLALEREARAAGRGIWALGFYRILPADAAAAAIGSFQIVEGEVQRVASAKGRTYLNFGADWRQDFTISVAGRDRSVMERQGLDFAALAGRRVRVRGWLESLNGPLIELTHAEQLELLP